MLITDLSIIPVRQPASSLGCVTLSPLRFRSGASAGPHQPAHLIFGGVRRDHIAHGLKKELRSLATR